MDKNKKYLYLGIIVLCIGVTVYFVFFMSSGGGESADLEAINTPVKTTPKPATQTNIDYSKVEYVAPQVFPAQNKFQTTVLDSAVIKSLNNYDRVTVTPEEVKRDDTFAKY